MILDEDLCKIRKEMEIELKKYKGKPIRFDIEPKILEQIVFEYAEDDDNMFYKSFAFPEEIAKKIDYTGLSFDDFNAGYMDFSGFVGVSLNPQTIFNKDLYCTVLNGVHFNNPNFFQVDISGAEFGGSTGAIIDPQVVRNLSLACTYLEDATVYDDFSCVDVFGAEMDGARIIKRPCDEYKSIDKCIKKIKNSIENSKI